MAKSQHRLHCSAVAASIALMILCSSTAAANLAATIGAAAANGLKGQAAAAAASNLTSNATYANVTANDGPPDKLQVDPKEWLKMGSELRAYLKQVFAGRPDMLQRIEDAWEKEKREVLGGSFMSYNAPSFFSNDENKVEAMSHTPGNPAINELYETGHPWAESRMEELVTGRGYPLEKYPVVTLDGYELIVYRIPYGRYRNNQPGVKKPVAFLQHGITLASDSMTIMNANESLAFVLADAGFDVWMGNTRGNTYSRRNVNGLYPYQQEFWYFSIDQLALIDLPTMVDFALQKTGAKKLAYAGHSQGATLVMALCAGRPEYNDKFSVVVNLGPVVFVDFFRTPFLRFAAINSLDVLLITLGFGEFLPNRLTAPLYLSLCTSFPLDELCAAAVSFFTFGPSIFITPDDYVTIATTWPSSVGTRNFNHWAQMFRTPEVELRQYDFGTVCNRTIWRPGHGFQPRPFFETCNQQVYGTETPPVYDLSKVTCPQVMFLGENDLLSVASDVEEEVRRLGPAHVGDFIYSDYGHMDFVWDRNSKHGVDMVDVFYRYSPGTF